MLYKRLLFSLTLIFFVFSTACGFSPKETVGAVDLSKIMKNSKTFTEIRTLETKIDELEKNMASKRESNKKVVIDKQQELEEISKNTWMDRVKAKEIELQQGLEISNKSFFDEKDKEMNDYIKSIEADINLKLDALKQEEALSLTSSARKEQIAKDADELKRQAIEKIQVKEKEIRAQVDEKMSPQKEAVRTQLDNYAQSTREEILKEQEEKFAKFMEDLFGVDQKKQNELKKEHDELLRKTDESVKTIVEKIAKSKNLEVVFSQYVENSKAVDITDDVMKELDTGK